MKRRLRLTLGAVGVAVIATASLVVAVPGASSAVSAEFLVEAVGSDFLLAAAVGVLAFVLVVAVVVRRGLDGIDQATMPDPETVQHADHPGVRFDRTVSERIHLLPHRPTEDERTLRERVRRAAERVTMQRKNVSRERAAEAVERGEWTRDDAAAAFLSDERRPPLETRLAVLVSPRSWFQVGARRAAAEVCRLTGTDHGSETDAVNGRTGRGRDR